MSNISTISSTYLIIFLPLISALLCNIFWNNKLNFFITIASIFASSLILLNKHIHSDTGNQITSNFEISVISLALEFRIDLLSIYFLIIIYLVKIFILCFYFFDFLKINLNHDFNNKFLAVFSINIFSVTGIILTNNLFNFFIFLELYAISLIALISTINDRNLLLINFKYFCINSISSLILLIVIALIYLMFWELDISKIFSDLKLIADIDYKFFMQISILFFVIIISKFFCFLNFYPIIKSRNCLTDVIFYEIFASNFIVGIYIIIRLFSIFLSDGLLIRDYNFNFLLMIIGLVINLYFLIKLVYQKNLKLIFFDFYFINLSSILICLSIFNYYALKSLFYLILINSIGIVVMIKITSLFNRYFKSCSIIKIQTNLIKNDFNIFKISLIIFAINFLLIFGFYGNYYLLKSIIQNKNWLLFFIIISLIISYFKILKIPVNYLFSRVLSIKNCHDDIIKFKQIKQLTLIISISFLILILFYEISKKINISTVSFANFLQNF